MRELRLIEILADTAAGLGDPELDPGAIEGVLAEALVRAGVPCDMHTSPAGVEVEWRGRPGRLELAFVNGLVECTRLTLAAVGLAGGHTLDVHGFSLELERAVAMARWRSQPLAVAVFEVEGLEMGPGMIDQADVVADVGALARSAVRQDDRVAHLGAAHFALLFPRAGTFEARSAFKRVCAALASSDHLGRDLSIGAAGFAELSDGRRGGDVLAEARERQATARMRRAYSSPFDPTRPLAG